MNISYKSSSTKTYLSYLLIIAIVVSFLYVIYNYASKGLLFKDDNIVALPGIIFLLIYLIVDIFRLKNVIVDENSIVIKTINGNKKIEYKDIIWICSTLTDYGNNSYFSIKYHDTLNNKLKILNIIPKRYGENDESYMAQYIRKQVMKINSSYKIENEPNRWWHTFGKWEVPLAIAVFIVTIVLLILV